MNEKSQRHYKVKSPLGPGTIMGSKKTKENNLLQTLAMFHIKERMTQKEEPRAQRAALRHFENYFQKLGLATSAWLAFDIAMCQ